MSAFFSRYRYAFALLLAVMLVQVFAIAAFAQAGPTPAQQLASSCAFGRDMGAGVNRIVAGLIGLLFIAVALGAVLGRMHGGGGGGGSSALMTVMVGGIDMGAAIWVGLGMFLAFGTIVATAASLPLCV